MARDMKFRAWSSKVGKMSNAFTFDSLLVPHNDDLSRSSENVVWMQYTGLEDRNGKEVCEGDLIKCIDGTVCSVEYDREYAYFTPFGTGDFAEEGWNVEVIGNIYENKELLDGIAKN